MESSTPKAGITLPYFCRQMWVSDAARKQWEPVIADFPSCWRKIEWMSVAHDVRPCALATVAEVDLKPFSLDLVDHGLKVHPLNRRSVQRDGRNVEVYSVAIGRRREVKAMTAAWEANDSITIGELLGYPACCRSAFAQASELVKGRDYLPFIGVDPTAVDSSPGSQRNVSGPPELNVFWKQLGLQLIPHWPCSFDCGGSLELARQMIAVGNSLGYKSTLDAVLQMFDWTAEWSSLHGIAEVRTPIMKISHSTVWTATKHKIVRRGATYPQEGAKAFKYRLATSEAPAEKKLVA